MDESVQAALDAHPDMVAAWRRNQPGAWGFLAGQAVLVERRRLGRSLTEHERRMVWHVLWETLVGTRNAER